MTHRNTYEREMQFEQVAALGRQAPIFLAFVLLTGVLVVFAYRNAIPVWLSASWLGGLAAVTCAGLGLRRRWQTHPPALNNCWIGLVIAVGLLVLLGAVWGVGLVLYDLALDPLNRMLTTVGTVAVIAVAAMLLAPLPHAVAAFVGPAVAPLVFVSIEAGQRIDAVCIAMMVVFSLAVLAISWNGFRAFAANVRSTAALSEKNLYIELLIRDFADTSSDWLWETDADLRFTHMSNRGEDGIGMAMEEVIGKTPWEMSERDPAADPTWHRHIETLLAHQPFHDFLYHSEHADGAESWLKISGKPRFDRDGNFAGYRGVMTDITAQRAAEQALRKAEQDLREANHRLEERVEERTRDLQRRQVELHDAMTRAEAASVAKSEFLANMSHELRTPLNAIIGFSEIIKNDEREALQRADLREYAEYIHQGGVHLLGVINDVLDFSKIESGQAVLKESELDLAQVIPNVVRQVMSLAREAGVTLQSDIENDLPHLLADELKVRQILLNLLSNAIKFTSSGGRICIAAARRRNGDIDLSVSDTGIGIAEADLPKVFDAFGQTDSTLSRAQEGTGLGVPLALAMTKLHGGALTIDSMPGVGTTVHVVLPADRAVVWRGAA